RVVVGNVDEALRQRPERLPLRRLPGGGQGLHRPTVEGAQAAIVSVRPPAWAPADRRLSRRRTSLRAHSLASAPELAKKTRPSGQSRSRTRRSASSAIGSV